MAWDMLRYLRLEGDLKSNVHFQPAGWLSHIDALKMSGVLTHRECIRPPFGRKGDPCCKHDKSPANPAVFYMAGLPEHMAPLVPKYNYEYDILCFGVSR